MRYKKAFTIIELMSVMAVVGIIMTIGVPMYNDYAKKTKISEVPFAIKGIAQIQIARKEDPALSGEYASDLVTLAWTTSNGTTDGKFYKFGTNGVEDCDPGTAADLMPIGLAEAWALVPDTVPSDWVTICLDSALNMSRNY